jgi:hypothetical protein
MQEKDATNSSQVLYNPEIEKEEERVREEIRLKVT